MPITIFHHHVRLEVAQFNEDGAHLGEVGLDHVGGHVCSAPSILESMSSLSSVTERPDCNWRNRGTRLGV